MIGIGLNSNDKQLEIKRYLKKHTIKKVYVFYFKKFKPSYKVDCDIEYIEYSDIIMYKFFYRLLEEIGNDSLIVMDECMRTQNRNELTYNCSHHYLNQTPHKLIFEYLPFIDDIQNFMILLDFENKSKYKGKSFGWSMLKEEYIIFKRNNIDFNIETVEISEKQKQDYEKEKENLFDNLGNKSPDTVPRNLHLFCGKFKKDYIKETENYIARNARYKKSNVITYKDASIKNLTMLDFPTRQLELNDYLKASETNSLKFISTGLTVDKYYSDEFQKWLENLEEFYGKLEASI